MFNEPRKVSSPSAGTTGTGDPARTRRQWEQLLARDISFARSRINDELDARLQALVDTWTQRINSEGMRVLRSKPQVFWQIEAELNAAMQDTGPSSRTAERAAELFDGNEELGLVVGAALQSVAPTRSGREVGKTRTWPPDGAVDQRPRRQHLTMIIPPNAVAGGVGSA